MSAEPDKFPDNAEVRATLIKGEKLAGSDFAGKIDPYVLLKIGDKVSQKSSVKQGNDVEWQNEVLSLYVCPRRAFSHFFSNFFCRGVSFMLFLFSRIVCVMLVHWLA